VRRAARADGWMHGGGSDPAELDRLIARVKQFRDEEGRTDPFEIHVISADSYTVDGIKGVVKEGGSGRRDAVAAALKTFGGKIESMYFAFGDTDVYVIVDAPDNVTAAALVMGVASTGTISVETTVLLSVEEMDQAAKKVVSFRGAGQ